jgi:hypothetical protein
VSNWPERSYSVTSHVDDTKDMMKLETILAQGLPPFYAWIRKQARKAEPIIFFEGHLAANPLACYINAELGDLISQAHLYEGVIYTSLGAQALSEDFQRFFWHFHDAFTGKYVTAGVLADWIAQGRPLPYQPDLSDYHHRRHEEICQALGQAITLVRQGFRDPSQPTEEECLGIALAKCCSWEGPRIARTCLRLCYAALGDANYATMERLLREHFGEEMFR